MTTRFPRIPVGTQIVAPKALPADHDHEISGADHDHPAGSGITGSGMATIFVAASDASARSKALAGAMYTCDGTADQVTIQAALDALPSLGGRVLLSEGTFDITEALTFTSNVTLEGLGWNSNLNVTANPSGGMVLDVSGNLDRVQFRNFQIDGNSNTANGIESPQADNVAAKSLRVDNLWIHDLTGNAIENLQDQTVIRDCLLASCTRGFYASGNGPDLMHIVDNTIVSMSSEGIYMQSDAETVISGNRITGCTTGIHNQNAHRFVITGNAVHDNSSHGLGITLTAGGSNDQMVVVGNRFSDNGGYGINVTGSNVNGPSLIMGNVLYGNTSGAWNDANGNAIIQANTDEIWKTWTPTYANLTIGNGTATARYRRHGKTVHCYFTFTLGSTSAVGTNPTVSTPVTASSSYTALRNVVGPSMHYEDGTATRMGGVRLASTTTLEPFVHLATSTYSRLTRLTSTIPFTWGTADILTFSATYEAA